MLDQKIKLVRKFRLEEGDKKSSWTIIAMNKEGDILRHANINNYEEARKLEVQWNTERNENAL